MNYIKTILLCVIAACIYGIIHDQITARICVEYFTVGHPPVFMTDDPTLLGIGWGIFATWWVGLIVGVGLAVAANGGTKHSRLPASLVRPVVGLLIASGLAAVVVGVTGFLLARNGTILPFGSPVDQLPRETLVAFQACGFAHSASYAVGFIGGIVVIASVWKSRTR